MKKYEVYMDLTISVTVDVHAENEEQAKKMAKAGVDANESYFISKYDALIERKVTEVHECEPDEDDFGSSDLKEAVAYVREQLGEDDMAILHAGMNKCYEMHLIPNDNTMDCSKVIDLLEEYGQDNDLPEGWWESECEMDEILAKL